MDLALGAMAGIAVLWVPGAIATRFLRVGSADPLTRFAQQAALGLAFWPVLFLFTTFAGLAWSALVARVFFAVLVVALVVLIVRTRSQNCHPERRARDLGGWGRATPASRRPSPQVPRTTLGMTWLFAWTAVVIIAIVAFTRIRHIDGVVLPLWVDSVHHTMIVRLLVEHGRLPASYAPFIPQSTFYYHWGFHAVTAFVAWVSGMTSAAQLPRLVLAFGQLLNVLVFFAVYCAAAALFRGRRVALLAATIATLVSLFPAYYVSWGRYTQLCGLLLLPPLARAFWRLGRHPRWNVAIEAAWLAAGLVLIHARVAIVFAVLAAILFAVLALQRRWRGMAWCAATGVTAMLVAAPWLVQLVRTPQVKTILAPAAGDRAQWETSNAAPDDLLWAPHNAILYSLATAGLLGLTPVPLDPATRALAIAWWVLLVVLLQRKSRRRGISRRDGWRIGIIALWVAVLALLINLDRLGLPRLRALPNSAAIIMLFLPVSLATAHLARWICDEFAPPRRRRTAMLALTLVVAIAGASTMLHIVNPVTVLATDADRRALDWIRGATPRNARFAVGVQPWIGGSYIGIDGGYWIPIVADRQSLLPPGLYPWVMPRDRVTSITRGLRNWYEAEQTGDITILDELRREGVTHVYFGPRNDKALRSAMATTSRAIRVYAEEEVEIYALKYR